MLRPPHLFKAAFALLFMNVLPCFLEAQNVKDVQKAIEQELVHKVLTVRGFYRDEDLSFDSKGVIRSKSEVGHADSDGEIEVQRVELKSDKLVVSGTLPVLYLDYSNRRVSYLRGLVKRRVEIDLRGPVTRDDIMKLLFTVFFRQGELIEGCPADEASRLQKLLPQSAFDPSTQESSLSIKRTCGTVPNFSPKSVQRVRDDIRPPQAIFTPDPPYTERARHERIQGTVLLNTVIGPEGHAESIMITRPLGGGLDEEAARAVHSWKFNPATRNGSPVVVVISIAVRFHLY